MISIKKQNMSEQIHYSPIEARHPNLSYLACVRHGESEYNAQGLWTGWIDIPLTEKGIEDARLSASMMTDIEFDRIIVSDLWRALQTMEQIQNSLELHHLPVQTAPAVRERHYGVYAGQNKWQVKSQIGDAEFQKIRRGFDTPIPQGESSRQVHDRVVPYYESEILPRLMAGENHLFVGHGNSIRALAMAVESLTVDEFLQHEVGIGEVHIYLIDQSTGQAIAKTIRAEKPDKGNV